MNVSQSIALHYAKQARTTTGHHPTHTGGTRPITVLPTTPVQSPVSTTSPVAITAPGIIKPTIGTDVAKPALPITVIPNPVSTNPGNRPITFGPPAVPVTIADSSVSPTKLPPIEDHSPPVQATDVITQPVNISKIDPIDQHGPVVPLDDSVPVEGKINPIRPHGPVSIDISSDDDSDDVKVGLIAPHSPPVGAGDPIDIGSDGGDDNRTLFDPAITGPANQFKSKLASASYAATASTTLVTGHAIPLNNLEA